MGQCYKQIDNHYLLQKPHRLLQFTTNLPSPVSITQLNSFRTKQKYRNQFWTFRLEDVFKKGDWHSLIKDIEIILSKMFNSLKRVTGLYWIKREIVLATTFSIFRPREEYSRDVKSANIITDYCSLYWYAPRKKTNSWLCL